jgi:endonuclease YncB( thermonuclease family)
MLFGLTRLCCSSKDLNHVKINDLKHFVPKIKQCKVIKVYDGDTITVAAFLKGDPECYKFQVRLNGIDSPEMKGSSENEKKHAIISRNALSDQILNQIITLDVKGNEKYGRLLADVLYNGKNMNEWMVQNGYAVKYDGGTKKRDTKWDEPI